MLFLSWVDQPLFDYINHQNKSDYLKQTITGPLSLIQSLTETANQVCEENSINEDSISTLKKTNSKRSISEAGIEGLYDSSMLGG